MQADAQPDRRQRCSLQIERARDRVARPPEGDNEAVALTLFDGPHTAVGTDHLCQSPVESSERRRHLGGLCFP